MQRKLRHRFSFLCFQTKYKSEIQPENISFSIFFCPGPWQSVTSIPPWALSPSSAGASRAWCPSSCASVGTTWRSCPAWQKGSRLGSRNASTSFEGEGGTAPPSTTAWPSLGPCWIKVSEGLQVWEGECPWWSGGRDLEKAPVSSFPSEENVQGNILQETGLELGKGVGLCQLQLGAGGWTRDVPESLSARMIPWPCSPGKKHRIVVFAVLKLDLAPFLTLCCNFSSLDDGRGEMMGCWGWT